MPRAVSSFGRTARPNPNENRGAGSGVYRGGQRSGENRGTGTRPNHRGAHATQGTIEVGTRSTKVCPMPPRQLQPVLQYLHKTVGGPATGPTDAELLERFVAGGDHGAFELLVWRHERMVLGVCRRLLPDPPDA